MKSSIPTAPISKEVIHSVAFKLKHGAGSAEEKKFLDETWNRLSGLPGVMDFKINRQVSEKNPYDFELDMKFENLAAYEAYDQHPAHWDRDADTGYVPELWMNEVDIFLEKDTQALAQQPVQPVGDSEIHHTVAFALKHAPGSKEEAAFLQISWDMLSALPGVKNFAICKQISEKSPYDFELTMDFDSRQAYDAYSSHPNHFDEVNNKGYVPEYWMNEVAEFLEKDTVFVRR